MNIAVLKATRREASVDRKVNLQKILSVTGICETKWKFTELKMLHCGRPTPGERGSVVQRVSVAIVLNLVMAKAWEKNWRPTVSKSLDCNGTAKDDDVQL